MFLYHYAPFEVDELCTYKMLNGRIESWQNETLSCFFHPLTKTQIDKLRSNMFIHWNKDLYCYKFKIDDMTFKEAYISSTPIDVILNTAAGKLSLEEIKQIRQEFWKVPYGCSKSQLKNFVKNNLEDLQNQDKYVNLQILMSKADPKEKGMYAGCIPHVLVYISKPVTKISLIAKH